MSPEPLQVVPQEPQEPARPRPLPPLPPEPTLLDDFRQSLAQERAQTEDILRQNFAAAVKSSPKAAGEAQQIARKLGLQNSQGIEDNLQAAKEWARRQAFDAAEVARENPLLAIQLRNVEFAKVAHEDIDNLRGTEGAFRRLGNAFQVGLLGNEQGYLGAKQLAGTASRYDIERADFVAQRLEKLGPTEGLLGGMMEMLGGTGEIIAKAAVLGATTAAPGALAGPGGAGVAFGYGFTAGVFGQSAVIAAGNNYLAMRRAGYDHEPSRQAAIAAGVVDGILNTAGVGILSRVSAPLVAPLRNAIVRKVAGDVAEALVRPTTGKAIGQALKSYAEGQAGMVGVMTVQRAVDLFAQEVARQGSASPGKLTSAISRGEIGAELVQAAVHAFQSTAIIGAFGPAAGLFRDLGAARRATAQAEAAARIADHGRESQVRRHNPEAHEESVTGFARAVNADALYVDGRTFANVLHQLDHPEVTEGGPEPVGPGKASESLGKILPDVAKQIPEAAATGGDVVMSAKDFFSKLAESEIAKALQPHLRHGVEEMSPAEAAPILKDAAKLSDRIQQQLDAVSEKQKLVAESARKVEVAMERQLLDTRRFESVQQARDAAKLYRSVIETIAQKTGQTPEEVHAARPLKVEAVKSEQVPTEALKQKGEPFRVDAYRGEGPSNLGKKGGPRFFSESETEAAKYGAVRKESLEFTKPLHTENWQEAKKALGLDASAKMEDVLQAARAAGHDGIVWKHHGVREFVDLRDMPGGLLHQGESRGAYDPSRFLMLLTEKANASTFIHEAAHHFLSVYADIAGREGAPEAIRADFQKLLDSFGVKDAEAWGKLSLEQQRKYHETFAAQFEEFLHGGEKAAPSLEQRTLFARFASWLRRVYKVIRDELNARHREAFGEDLPVLTDEVRGVMERMLASEEAIAEAKAAQSMSTWFQSKEEALKAGISEDEWNAHVAREQEATEAAEAAISQESVQAMQWTTVAATKALKQQQAAQKQVRATVRAEVESELRRTPIRRAERWLRYGEHVDEEGNVSAKVEGAKHKLAEESVRVLVPEGADAEPLKRLMAKEGLAPDDVAEAFGLGSGDRLVRELLALEPLKDEVEAKTTQRLLERFSDLFDPQKAKQAINEALHNEARARFLAAGVKTLLRTQQPIREMVVAARIAAERQAAKTPVGEISPDRYLAAERRAAREVLELVGKGKLEEAGEAQRRQLLQNQLAKVAMDVERERDQAIDSFRRFNYPDSKLGKQRDIDWIAAGRAILGAFGIGRGAALPLAEMALLKEHNPGLFDKLAPLVEQVTKGDTLQDWHGLTLEQFRDLRDSVNALWQQSKREKEIVHDGKRLQREAIDQEIAQRIAETAKLPGMPEPPTETPSDSTRRANSFFGSAAWIKRVEHWAWRMDGGQAGPVTRYIFREVRTKYDDYLAAKNVEVKAFRDRTTAMKWWGETIEAPELGENGFRFRGRAELVGLLRHLGNNSNAKKAALGWELVDALPDGGFDAPRLWGFVQRMVNEGKLTREDFRYVQAEWDQNQRLKGPLQAAFMDRFGYRFEEVEAQPFTITFPDGKTERFDGGYVPAKIDVDALQERNPILAAQMKNAELLDGLSESERDVRRSFPSAGKGWSISRVEEANYPLVLDVRQHVRHLDAILRFTHMQGAVSDVMRLLRSEHTSTAIQMADRSAIQGMLIPWLQRTALNQVAKPSEMPLLDKFFSFLRRTSGMARMFGNLVNASQQALGLVNSSAEVEGRHLRTAAWQLFSSPFKTAADVKERSQFMRERLSSEMAAIQDDIKLSLDPSWWGSATRWTQRHAYFLQRAFQNPVDIITWVGKFNEVMEKSGKDKTDAAAVREATLEADSAVRRTQGSNDAPDIARYEAGTPLARLFTQFSGYANNVLNHAMAAEPGLARAGVIARAAIIPGLVGAAMATFIGSGTKPWDDKDHDGTGKDDFTWWLLKTSGSQTASFVPGIGPAASSIIFSGGERASVSPAVGTVQDIVHGLASLKDVVRGEKPELTGRDIHDLFTAFSLLLGVPVSAFGNPFSYMQDVRRGRIQPGGPLDYARGLLTGR